jgi:hypothetical protein
LEQRALHLINCTVGMGKLAIILMSLLKRPKSNLT